MAISTLAALAAGGLVLLRPRRPARPRSIPPVDPEQLDLPPDFRFGAATAAHQVEGSTWNNNWTRWEEAGRPDGQPGIVSGDRCGLAADHWRRFDADLDRMKDLGLTMYRFSIEWSRIEPQENVFDSEALDRYRTWCEKLLEAGITPMVTLHHFSEPLWITDRGGFERRDTVDAFARFVRYVVPRLADVVDHWVTVNEPVVYAVLGWWAGEFPPGKREPALMARVLENLLLAHAEAYHVIHELDRSDADGDGVPCLAAPAANIVVFEPASALSPVDAYLARLLDQTYNRAALDALETGRLRLAVPGLLDLDVTHPRLAGTWDFAAVNHYFRLLAGLRYLFGNPPLLGFDPSADKNDMGWDLSPHSLYEALRLAAEYGRPIYVTENGTCDADVPDRRRHRHLLDALGAVERAVRDGIDVRGYLYWSLLDNFEWSRGFAPRFGLYRVDYATQDRTLTTGGALYRDVIAHHRRRHAAPAMAMIR